MSKTKTSEHSTHTGTDRSTWIDESGRAHTNSGVSGTAAVTTTGSGGSTKYQISITGSEAQNTFVLAGTYLTVS